MQLELLSRTLEDFRIALDRGWSSGLEALYETQAAWQTHWPPTSVESLPDVLELSLTSGRTRALWQGHAYYPKEVLIQLATFAPEMINLAFGRLFNPDLELGERWSGFVFYLDEVLAELTRVRPLKAPMTHYHEDYRAPSLYTAARFPATDAYFEAQTYLQALRNLRAPNVGTVAEPNRFAKSVKVTLAFMGKNESFFASQKRRFDPAHRNPIAADAYRADSALVVSEYFRWLTKNK